METPRNECCVQFRCKLSPSLRFACKNRFQATNLPAVTRETPRQPLRTSRKNLSMISQTLGRRVVPFIYSDRVALLGIHVSSRVSSTTVWDEQLIKCKLITSSPPTPLLHFAHFVSQSAELSLPTHLINMHSLSHANSRLCGYAFIHFIGKPVSLDFTTELTPASPPQVCL
ncbi:hypothetical protein GOODEAATRI_017215 [Goodea atripinnis]|uniref:Uncharacterized protein n=1 Tax=Goodea atripinnis TaxID=208336 RepID=A0ABV0P4V2_9TELE